MFRHIAGLLLLLSLLLMGGCADGPDTDGMKIYRHSLNGSPTSLDPAQSATIYANHVVVNVYDTLYSYKYLTRPYQIKPNLAEAMPETSEDGLTYTIRIKQGVKFIDDPAFPNGEGREVTAADFVYSLKRHFDPKTRSQGSWFWAGRIKGMAEWKKAGSDYDQEVEGLRALDRYTIQIILNKPFPQLVHTLAQGYAAIVPREAVEHYGREFSVRPVGSGPFKLQRFDSVGVVLVKNPAYRQEPIDLAYEGYDEALHGQFGIEEIDGKIPPLVDRLEIHFIKEPLSRWNSFTKGDEIQYAGIPKELLDDVLAEKKPDIILKPQYAERYFMTSGYENGFVHTDFNMRDPEIGYNQDQQREEMNHALRCAIRYAFDWDDRNQRFYNNMGFVFPGIIPPVTPEYDSDGPKDALEHNPEKGRKLLKEAGWTTDMLPTLTYGGIASVDSRQMFEQFRGWLTKIGYPKEKIVFDSYASFGDYNRAVKKAKIKMVGMGWGLDYPDAENTLQLFYGPNGSPGSNNANFNDPEYNRLYEQTAVMQPSPERTKLYRKMNQIVLDACVTISGLSRRQIFLWHKDVVSFPDQSIVGGFHLKYVDVKEAKK
ncbi:ABC transporter substrate-binding protein [Thiolapillus sp.]